MQPDKLYNDPELAQFYDIENEWAADLAFIQRMAAGCTSILDLGCGTGQLAAVLAQERGKNITAVDPAEPMLDFARRKPGGDRVRWVRGDARNIRLNESFDLIVLSGHAFQVFLMPEDQQAVIRTISIHLAPEGRFIFDTRNPEVEEWKEWTPDESRRHIIHPALGECLAWNDVVHDPETNIVEYETHYRILADDRAYSARSSIAFPSQEQTASMLNEAGLYVESWLGDWNGAPYNVGTPEIIPIGRLAERNPLTTFERETQHGSRR